MFVILKDRILGRDTVGRLINGLEHLCAVLRAIQDGHGPTAQELTEAPILNNWSIEIEYTPSLRIMADSTNDLFLPKGETLREMPDLWIFAEQQGWVRGLAGWYRLGSPLGPISPS
jgi:hypothetical protein